MCIYIYIHTYIYFSMVAQGVTKPPKRAQKAVVLHTVGVKDERRHADGRGFFWVRLLAIRFRWGRVCALRILLKRLRPK